MLCRMIHVVTTHVGSDRWVEPQRDRLERHTSEPYLTWAALGGEAAKCADAFDNSFQSRGPIAPNFQYLATEVGNAAHPHDLLVFLDGDAFPVADWTARVRGWLARRPLAAVRRDENLGDPQPHHLFCVTTVGFWNEIGGDWRGGPLWSTTTGRSTTDHGARLWRTLVAGDIPWHPILRSNQVDLHPVWFGVYGGIVYHHGASFRQGRRACRWDGAQYAQLPGPSGRAARWVAERATSRLADRLADRIAAGDEPIDELRGLRPTNSQIGGL